MTKNNNMKPKKPKKSKIPKIPKIKPQRIMKTTKGDLRDFTHST